MINSGVLLSIRNEFIFLVEIVDMNINNKNANSIIVFITKFTLLTAAVS